MAIRGIFFDAADVLYHRPEPTSAYVARLLSEKGLVGKLTVPDQRQQGALRAQARRGRLSPDQYWDQLLTMYGVADPDERKSLTAKIVDHSDRVLPIPGGRKALTGLKERGFVLGIVTDTIYPLDRKMRWLHQVGVAEFMDVIACSTVLGVYKPDPAIYHYAVEQAHLTPGESAFVGHADDELEGARQAGLDTVAVNHGPAARADYYALSLLDLLNVPIFQQPHP